MRCPEQQLTVDDGEARLLVRVTKYEVVLDLNDVVDVGRKNAAAFAALHQLLDGIDRLVEGERVDPDVPHPYALHGTGSGLDQLLELTVLIELGHDVAAAHELPVDIELGDRRPGGELLDSVAHFGISEHVDVDERLAHLLERPHHTVGKTALREALGPFHEKDDFIT